MSVKAVSRAVAILLAGVTMCATVHASTYAYVSNADSQDISVFSLDKSNGALKAVETVSVGGTVNADGFFAESFAALCRSAFKAFSRGELRSQSA
jgi:phage tail sheath gpL-like